MWNMACRLPEKPLRQVRIGADGMDLHAARVGPVIVAGTIVVVRTVCPGAGQDADETEQQSLLHPSVDTGRRDAACVENDRDGTSDIRTGGIAAQRVQKLRSQRPRKKANGDPTDIAPSNRSATTGGK